MNLEKLNDKNYIPFIERESKYDYISLGIEPIFTTKYEENLDFDALPAAKMRTTRISTNIGRIKKMTAIKSTMFCDQEYDDIKVTKVAPKESKTIENQGLDKLGTNKTINSASKNLSNPSSVDCEPIVEKKQRKKKLPEKNDSYNDFFRRENTIKGDNYKIKTRNNTEEKTRSNKRSQASNNYSQSSKSADKSRRDNPVKSHSILAKELLEKRKMINEKYTFRCVRSGSRKSGKKSVCKKSSSKKSLMRIENENYKDSKPNTSVQNIKISTMSFRKSPRQAALKIKKKNNASFSTVFQPARGNPTLKKEEKKTHKLDHASAKTPRSYKKVKKLPRSPYLINLINNEKDYTTKMNPLLREQNQDLVFHQKPQKEFGSAKKFKQENRGNRSKRGNH